MARFVLDFEKPIIEIELKLKELNEVAVLESDSFKDEINKLSKKLPELKRKIYGNLTPWQRVQLARHPERPFTLDYINEIFEDFVEIHGDRHYADDEAMIAGMGKFEGQTVMIIGQQKGRDTKEKIRRNFGMPHPEGYRKALRAMKMAEKFSLPIFTFIDTPGAYPGIGAEERGQGEAIAVNLREMAVLKTPIICTIIGEGASGGALGIGVGDRILMLENAWYSVISPEGCAAILYGDRVKAEVMSKSLKLDSDSLLKLKVIDEKIAEPLGGANRDLKWQAEKIKKSLSKHLKELEKIKIDDLIELRIEKFDKLGEYKND